MVRHTKKHVLIPGGAGYIGSVLCGYLLEAGYRVTVVDRFFFGRETLAAYEKHKAFRAVQGDTRDLDPALFQGVDAVIDLAGLSNDPSCDIAPELTRSVNKDGAILLARQAKKAGVKRLIYVSSCSVYGQGGDALADETTPKRPVSLYAECKIDVEKELSKLADKDFCVSFPRLATVFGASPRMRFDLIINIMTMFAITRRKIIVMGGGRQWRPLVHVRDVCRALLLLLAAPTAKIQKEAFNVGSNSQTYRVIEVARLVQDSVPFVEVDIAPDDPDKRSYRVDFSKIEKVLKFKASLDAAYGIREVADLIRRGDLDGSDLRTSTSKYYKFLLDAEKTLQLIRFKGRVL